MKKKFQFSIILLISVVFTSCVWIPKSNREYMNKRSLKAFNELKDPFVIGLDVREDFSLYGNDKLDEQSRVVGRINLIYDWENDKVADYIFLAETNASQGPLGMIKDSNGNKIYCELIDQAKFFSTLNASEADKTGIELKTITKKMNGYSDRCFAETVYPDVKKALFLYVKNSDKDWRDRTICLYNPDTKQFEEELSFRASSTAYWQEFQTDTDGNYWFEYEEETEYGTTETITSFRRVDVESNKLDEPFISLKSSDIEGSDETEISEGYYYDLKYVDSECLLIEKYYYKNHYRKGTLLYVSRKDKSIVQIAEPEFVLSEDSEVKDFEKRDSKVVRANGKIYCFQRITIQNDYSWRVLELDTTSKKAKQLCYVDLDFNKFDYFQQIMVRDSKIFFFNYTYLYCYDTLSNTFSFVREFKQSDFTRESN